MVGSAMLSVDKHLFYSFTNDLSKTKLGLEMIPLFSLTLIVDTEVIREQNKNQ